MRSSAGTSAAVLLLAACLVPGLAQKQVQEDPCKTKGRIVGDATYCDRYWECQDGQPELYDCPNGLVYAGKNRGVTEGCDYPWRANYCDGKTQANPPIGREHCDWLYGIFGHETSCTRYWTCWNGTSTEQLCIGGLLYNENTHSCDWPENVDGCQKHPLCNDDANGNVPLGKSCNRYWQCQGGYPRLQRCPAMLVFDKRTLRCVVPPTEDCEVPTTIAPPPEEEDEGPNVPQGAPPQRGQQQQGGQPQRAPQGFQQRQQDYQQSNQRAQEANQRTQDYQQSNQRNQDYQNNQRQQDYQQSQRAEQRQDYQPDEGLPFNIPPGAIPLNNPAQRGRSRN
ncbi:Chitin Hypothetical protein Peritrophin-A domain [Nesidiocoris tenuis]|uniref:Chitin-binding type-2 domain-containing protein n=1 Tax=Nesidiocoris tenuis TaxID=355587 RepID=A0ABN7ATH8_9HEMI|nr:Chitin Hypothetical protein Peritrophin-A domain [Nesidiocoris tenuis]